MVMMIKNSGQGMKGKRWFVVRFKSGKSMNVMGIDQVDVSSNKIVQDLGPVISIKPLHQIKSKEKSDKDDYDI